MVSRSRLANLTAGIIEEAFDGYRSDFRAVTRRASDHFVARRWQQARRDAEERLELYDRRLVSLLARLRGLLGERVDDRLLWAMTKAVWSGRVAERPDAELAETFFSSVVRRVCGVVGADPDLQFVHSDSVAAPAAARQTVHRRCTGAGQQASDGEHARTTAVLTEVLSGTELAGAFADLHGDARRAAARLEAVLEHPVDVAEVLDGVFYRRRGAYIVGRVRAGGRARPVVLALASEAEGVVVDAVLADEDDVSVLFSFTRSHFLVDLEPPRAVVRFLAGLLPRKPIAELTIALGQHRHGKTELYRSIARAGQLAREPFAVAPGTPGLVMIVFTVPGSDLVVKVIRDRIPTQKRLTPGDVRARYEMVFRHDRAGRLVEAHEFDRLELERDRFTRPLLDELAEEASRTVTLDRDRVVLHHAYVERRVTPLDVYLSEADEGAARTAVRDYGQALRDLAATDIFPGDPLLKNFGVTRHGRVVSYDYDELTRVSSLRFRRIPPPRTPEEELAGEPWYGVDPGDVFPEELATFSGLSGALAEAFQRWHGDLLEPAFWQDMQRRLAAREVLPILPYPAARRLKR